MLDRARGSPRNLRFRELVSLAESFGFRLVRIKGSHHIYARPGIPELINLQEADGRAKPYQVRQFLKLLDKYKMAPGDER